MTPECLVIGHIVKDMTPCGWSPGGPVVYACAQASRLGLRTAAVTVCGPDVQPPDILPEVEWHTLRDDTSTCFENRYGPEGRRQRLLSLARPIEPDDIPVTWTETPIVLVGPVFHDVSERLPALFSGRRGNVGLGAQGWLRRQEADCVLPGTVACEPGWLTGNVVFVSEEDVDDVQRLASWRRRVPLVVLTRGSAGCSVWDATGRRDFAAFETDEVDATGAGDVFSLAFLYRLRETGSACEAAEFASAAAALSVQAPGTAAIAGRREIEALMRSQGARRASPC